MALSLYHSWWRREMGLGALRHVSLKKARELANQWRSVLHEGCDPIKERNKQKRETMRNLHYLKDIALDTFGEGLAALGCEIFIKKV